jgi:phosphate transport system substrate-binding protein
MAVELEYVVLPDAVKNLVRNSWANIKDAAGKPVATR